MIYLKLFLTFAKVGLFGFGGGIAMLPMIYQGAMEFGFISKEGFSNLVGISQVTPGPLAVNAATYVGYTNMGVPGAVISTLGVALPSFVLVLLTVKMLDRFKNSDVIAGAFTGIRPVTVGLMVSAVFLMGETAVTGPTFYIPLMIALFSAFSAWKLRLGPVVIMVGAAIIGAVALG